MHNNLVHRSRAAQRSGVTILEVMFAIFVVIIGLLGIASILPLAARNASDSNAHNNAQALGQRWFQSFFAFRLNEHDAFTSSQLGYNWQWYRDYGSTPSFELYHKSYADVDAATRTRVEILPGTNQSATKSNTAVRNLMRVWGHQAVCIDPLFFTEPEVRQHTGGSSTGRPGGYRLAVFPYFNDNYNPLTDPFDPTNAWPDQPRMVRVTLGFGTTTAPGSQVSRKLVEDIFSSPDDVSVDADEKDKTLAATRIFDSALAKALSSGQYSWLATLSPREPLPTDVLPANAASTALATSDEYLISLVVMNRRDRQFVAPGSTLLPGNPEDKPGGERLVWVYPLSGSFTGGVGGRVRLISNAATRSVLHIGDWIMLGKHYLTDPTDAARRYSYFRWYRIIAVDEKTRVGTLGDLSPSGTDPYGAGASMPVWSRDVVLEGPDFALLDPGPPPVIVPPVTGTLMSGVVTVVERNLTIQ